MLSKKHRFSRAEFDAFIAQPSLLTTYNRLGTLKFASDTSSKKGVFAVVTSSKHEKRAVIRNRLRRRLYTALRTENPAFSGVFYASKQSYGLDPEEIKKLFNTLITHAAHGAPKHR